MKDEKIKQIAYLLDEAPWRVKDALGLSEPDYNSLMIKTINELKIIFRDSSSNSEEEFNCQQEFVRRLEIEIASGVLARVRDAHFLAIEVDLEEEKLKALQKWEELSLQEVQKSFSYEDLKVACDRAPKSGLARSLAHKKKEAIVARLFIEATKIDDYIAVFKKAPQNSPIRPLAVRKISDLLGD